MECSVVDPCNQCDYCSGYREWLYAADNTEPCPDCGGSYCDGTCPESYENEQISIDSHVKNCKIDGFCMICQCL